MRHRQSSSRLIGRSNETRHRLEGNSSLRVTAVPAAALSKGRAESAAAASQTFADLHRAAVDGLG
jgi:hypothetical protein